MVAELRGESLIERDYSSAWPMARVPALFPLESNAGHELGTRLVFGDRSDGE